ncbi:hypothetical protein Bbelb_283000 [Branchiostoma belcheri]|nr:hypothetical protein Bbelb_283000 [Branchiostoma belcheri]
MTKLSYLALTNLVFRQVDADICFVELTKAEQCKALLKAALLEGLDSERLLRSPGSKVGRGLVGRFLLKATDGTSVETLASVRETDDGTSADAVPETLDGSPAGKLPAVPETRDDGDTAEVNTAAKREGPTSDGGRSDV